MANSLNITRGAAAAALLNVSPASLSFVAGAQATITITNNASSSQPATNVIASIPGGSSIMTQNNSCNASLAVGASCTIIVTAATAEGPTPITISGSNTNASQVAVTVTPVAVSNLSVSPTVLIFTQNMTGTLTVFNDSTSTVAAIDVNADIPVGSAISVSANNCSNSLVVGASCTIVLTSTAIDGPTPVAIRGVNTNTQTISVTATATPMALLSVNPPSLTFTVGGTGTVNVTNSFGSTVAANGITSAIPSGSSITENSNTCLPSLAVGGSCSISYTGSVAEGPTDVTVSGNNTTSENVALTVASTPTATIGLSPSSLTFTAGGNAALTVTNNSAYTVSAMDIVASIPQGSTISVLTNGCTANLAPGANCSITFTSPVSAAATVVTVSGSNTNAPSVSITVEPACIPITVSSTPGVVISASSGQVLNVSRLIDVDLNNFCNYAY